MSRLSLDELSKLEQFESEVLQRLEQRKQLRSQNITSLAKTRTIRQEAELRLNQPMLDHCAKANRDFIAHCRIDEDEIVDVLAELERGSQREEMTLSLIRTILENESKLQAHEQN